MIYTAFMFEVDKICVTYYLSTNARNIMIDCSFIIFSVQDIYFLLYILSFISNSLLLNIY